MKEAPDWLEEAVNDPLQMSMFDGEAARDKAIENLDAAYDEWVDSVMNIIESIPIHQTFTTDYLWENVETIPNEPRAMGAAMARAGRQALASPTGRYVKSRRPECHARPVMVWRRV